jgi:hypothetical protein
MKEFKTQKGTLLPILNLRGKEYLEVRYRILWFREQHPDWSIETEFVETGMDFSCCKATIKDATGRIMATGHKYEDVKGFPDHREKSETSSIGRALALVGFGTQFAADDLDEGKRIVDSPVERPVVIAGKKVQATIKSEQPTEEDGNFDAGGYRIPFGKFAKKSLEQVGSQELMGYVNYLEEKAEKDGKQIIGVVAEFIERASAFIACEEMKPLL